MSTSGKFIGPHLSKTVLHRERLYQALSDAIIKDSRAIEKIVPHYKAVLCYAPAGYGKTTIIADFVSHTSQPCCWYFLDTTDSDRLIFLQRLLASIRACFPQFGQTLEGLITNALDIQCQESEQHFETLIDTLVQAIDTEIPQSFVLILGNYHAINAHQGINRLVTRLLHHLPSNCVIIIESRAIPNLDCEYFLLQHELLVIGTNKLMFTAQEVEELTHLQGITHLERKEIEKLTAYFEGWIAGILLGTRLSDIEFLSSAAGGRAFLEKPMNREKLFSYLVNEVFHREPEVYTFLQDASILYHMTPGLCNALLEITDAEKRLMYIERQGLFITSSKSDSDTFYYVCHPVLRELFYEELKQLQSDKFIALNYQAACLLQKDEPIRAIFHALEAQNYTFAADILSQISQDMLMQGYSETISHYIDVLPTHILDGYPHLLLSRANIYLRQYEIGKALVLLEKALKLHQAFQGEDKHTKVVTAEILIAQSSALFHLGEYLQAEKICKRAIDLLPVEEYTQRALAYQRLGLCASEMGDGNHGLIYLQQALQLWGHHIINRQTASLYGQLAKAYNMIGNYALTEHHRTRAILYWEQLDDIEGKVNNLIGLGVTYLHQGTYAHAESTLDQALTLARAHNFPRKEAYALINLGELYQEQHHYKSALTAIENGLALARLYRDSYLTNYALCSLAMVFSLMDDSQTALLLLSEVDLKVNQNMSYEGCFYHLIQATVLLGQGRYEEAYTSLSNLESITDRAGWKRRQLQVLIRLTACQLALEKSTLAVQTIEKAAGLARLWNYEHLVQVELHHHQTVAQLIQMSPPQNSNEMAVQKVSQQSQNTWNIHVNQPYLRTLALGIPTVLLDNKPISRWRMTKAIELYFLLLDSDRPLHKERITVALWPDANEQADQSFRSAIHYLRKAIGEECVIHHSGTYGLNLQNLYGDHIWYDVAVFKHLYTQGKNALRKEDELKAKEHFQEMITLYRGDYVQSFYSDWCRLRREELVRIYMDALTRIAHISWKHDLFEETFHYYQKMLEVESLQENAHYGIMRYYIHQGNFTQALQHYQNYKESLQNELSTIPGISIQKLYHKILQQNSE